MDDGSGSGGRPFYGIHAITAFVNPFTSDVPSESLGYFYWSMRPVSNACNFVWGAGGSLRGTSAFPLGSTLYKRIGAKRHDVDC